MTEEQFRFFTDEQEVQRLQTESGETLGNTLTQDLENAGRRMYDLMTYGRGQDVIESLSQVGAFPGLMNEFAASMGKALLELHDGASASASYLSGLAMGTADTFVRAEKNVQPDEMIADADQLYVMQVYQAIIDNMGLTD